MRYTKLKSVSCYGADVSILPTCHSRCVSSAANMPEANRSGSIQSQVELHGVRGRGRHKFKNAGSARLSAGRASWVPPARGSRRSPPSTGLRRRHWTAPCTPRHSIACGGCFALPPHVCAAGMYTSARCRSDSKRTLRDSTGHRHNAAADRGAALLTGRGRSRPAASRGWAGSPPAG